jgi:hypothetical protein
MINSGTWSKVKWNAIGIGIYKEYGSVWFGEVEDRKREGMRIRFYLCLIA